MWEYFSGNRQKCYPSIVTAFRAGALAFVKWDYDALVPFLWDCLRLPYGAEEVLPYHQHKVKPAVHQSNWSRPVGRLYTSWMATLKSGLSLHNLTFEDTIQLALDKSLWRLLVASGATYWHGACRIMMTVMMSGTGCLTHLHNSAYSSFYHLTKLTINSDAIQQQVN